MEKKLQLGLLLAIWVCAPNEVLAQQGKRPAFEHVHSLAMDSGGQTLFLGAHTGLFRSDDRGRTWKKVSVATKHAHLDVMDIAADPREPKTIYMATHEAGVLKSTDGGKTWKEPAAVFEDRMCTVSPSTRVCLPSFTLRCATRAKGFTAPPIKAENGFASTTDRKGKSKY